MLSLSTAFLRLVFGCAGIKRRCPRGEAAVAVAGLDQESVRTGAVPSSEEVLNLIATKYLQQVNPSTPEEFNKFRQYMKDFRKVLIADVQKGSLILILECSSLQILDELWKDYWSGHLNEVAQKWLVTEEILMEFGLAEVKLTTTIDEEEYKDCRELLLNPSSRYLDLIINPKYTY